jgi:short-subunit dehydrogenase
MTWVLVTGATSGIGKDAALRFARAGLRVIATGRDPKKLAELPHELVTVELDVRDAGSLERAVRRVDELTGGHRVDVLVNNAGYGEMGPLETIPLERVRAMFETNVIGLARVTRAFVPAMRRRGRGRVINVSSLLGRMTIAAQGAYAATKHALEALSDALRQELAAFGVDVILVEPGSVDTPFADIAFGALEERGIDADWASMIQAVRGVQSMNQRTAARPEAVSKVLLEAINAPHPSARYVVPLAAAAQLAAARVAPRGLWEAAIRRAMGIRVDRARALPRKAELALVTGAGGGIGKATALRLAQRKVAVIATDRDETALARVARAAKEARLPVETMQLDVTDAGSIARVAAHVQRRTGGRGLDVLVNNAGYAELGPIELATDEAWRAQLEVNVYGVLAVTRVFSPAMRRAGAGRIVNVSSIAGLVSFPFMGVYCASKFALEAITDVLRLELGAFGIHVAAVQPAFIRSGFAARAKATVARYDLARGPYAPIGERMEGIIAKLDALGGEPEDVARAIARAALDSAPAARYRAPFSAEVASRLVPHVPTPLLDRGLAQLFELDRLGAR